MCLKLSVAIWNLIYIYYIYVEYPTSLVSFIKIWIIYLPYKILLKKLKNFHFKYKKYCNESKTRIEIDLLIKHHNEQINKSQKLFG